MQILTKEHRNGPTGEKPFDTPSQDALFTHLGTNSSCQALFLRGCPLQPNQVSIPGCSCRGTSSLPAWILIPMPDYSPHGCLSRLTWTLAACSDHCSYPSSTLSLAVDTYLLCFRMELLRRGRE